MARPLPDVVVVGGGPAGSATALGLSRRGHRVLLLERAASPRVKPCGECVNPAGVEALERLGALEALSREPSARLIGWRISDDSGNAFRGRFPEGHCGMGIARDRLDATLLALAAAAGVEVETGAHVTDLVFHEGRARGVRVGGGRGSRTVAARVVVGADGMRSVVLRRLGLLRRPPRLRKLALTVHLEGEFPSVGEGRLRVGRRAVVGVAPTGSGRGNGVVVVGAEEALRVRGRAEAYARALLETEDGAVRISGEVRATGPFDWSVRRACAPGALLVGDAAGYYDPFTGQGIFRALRGAELAVDAVDALLRGAGERAELRRYARLRQGAFAPGERLQRLLEVVLARPALLGWALRRLRGAPATADALVGVIGDLHPVRSLLRPAHVAPLVVRSGRDPDR
jgi:menaquinone-9 beta-reductase